jgi:hypothetical protein
VKKKIIHGTKKWFPILSIIIIAILVGVSLYNLRTSFSRTVGQIIIEDVEKLSKIFKQINDQAGIMEIHGIKTPINFLNIKKGGFTGSQVGPLNLEFPDKWQGPYLQQNPEVENIQYNIIKTKRGHFIVPGDGVKLPNGKIIGKDIIFTENSDIDHMGHDEKILLYNGKPLVEPLTIKKIFEVQGSAALQPIMPDEWSD